MATVSLVEFKAELKRIVQEHEKKFSAIKAQIDAEMESYLKNPTQDITAMIKSQNDRLAAFGSETAMALGNAFDDLGLTQEHAPQEWALVERINDQLIAGSVEYLKDLNRRTEALPKMITKPRKPFFRH